MIALLLLMFIAVILFEVPGLVKKKMWRELVAFSGYLLLGMVLSIPQVLGIKILNPSTYIETALKTILELFK